MQYQPVLDTALGLCFIFFAAALFTSGFVEWLANVVKKRAKTLLVGLSSMLDPQRSIDELQADDRSKMLRFYTPSARKEAALYYGALDTGAPTRGEGAITAEMIIGHPLIQPFRNSHVSASHQRNPSYIPADVAARALFDTMRTRTGVVFTVDENGRAVAPPGGGADDPIQAMLEQLPAARW